MLESIQIEYTLIDGCYELISYSTSPIKVYNEISGLHVDGNIINVHVSTYLNYVSRRNGFYAMIYGVGIIDFIDSVIKQIKRKETINKLLNE